MTAKRESMAGLAELLSRQLAKPVDDRTMLDGLYDVTLTWATDGVRVKPSEFSQWPPLEDAVVAQLGLKLEKVKVPIRVYIVDTVARIPQNQ